MIRSRGLEMHFETCDEFIAGIHVAMGEAGLSPGTTDDYSESEWCGVCGWHVAEHDTSLLFTDAPVALKPAS